MGIVADGHKRPPYPRNPLRTAALRSASREFENSCSIPDRATLRAPVRIHFMDRSLVHPSAQVLHKVCLVCTSQLANGNIPCSRGSTAPRRYSAGQPLGDDAEMLGLSLRGPPRSQVGVSPIPADTGQSLGFVECHARYAACASHSRSPAKKVVRTTDQDSEGRTAHRGQVRRSRVQPDLRKRARGFEPPTYSLEGCHSTTELRPRWSRKCMPSLVHN